MEKLNVRFCGEKNPSLNTFSTGKICKAWKTYFTESKVKIEFILRVV